MKHLLIIIFLVTQFHSISAQTDREKGNPNNLPVKEYRLTIDEKMVNITGKEVMGMAVNGSIPGPVLRFMEGEYAVIYVTNNMKMETSVHWHGLLLPNFQDGVPYVTTPPILPGKTHKFEFPLIHSGTYWYHSHTMLQEQSGVYGSIVIEPKEKNLEYDSDLVVVLSDWTNEKPGNVLRNLKRGNEWYGIKKGTATPLNRVIARGALGAQINFWKQRMEGADIADIYYPAFLSNGQITREYPDFKPGEKVRVRIINAAASTYFWLTFGGKMPLLVSSDGVDVEPVRRNKTLIGNAETYDFIITIPENGKLEVRASAMDGSGKTSTFLGKGDTVSASDVPRPDKIGMMQKMAKMDMVMGAPATKFRPKKDERFAMMKKYGMQMDHEMSDPGNMQMDHKMEGMNDMKKSDDAGKKHDMKNMPKHEMKDSLKMNHHKMDGMDEMKKPTDSGQKQKMHDMKNMPKKEMNDSKKMNPGMKGMSGMNMSDEFNYDFLKSKEKTAFTKDLPKKEILLNLTGNMWRYLWSLNGVPLSETDNILIKKGEVTRITFNNLTMMHHPMHLHGHFFRVINKNGEYSPLKHTVNVPPMQKVVIEFEGNETGDWFMHCHVLYHMMSGMARVFSYDTPRDIRMKGFPLSKATQEGEHFFKWGMLDAASHMAGLNLISSNARNQFNFSGVYGWNQNMEAEVSYERYMQDYFRVFGGVNFENEIEGSLDEISTTAVVGIRYFTPYMFDLDMRIDNQLRPQVGIGRELMIFPRLSVFGEIEYQADFGWVNDFESDKKYKSETVWGAGLDYMLSRKFSITASYDNRFGAGGGLSLRF